MGGVGTHVVGGSWVCVGGWVHCSVGYGRCEFLHGRLLCGRVGVGVHVCSLVGLDGSRVVVFFGSRQLGLCRGDRNGGCCL